MKTYLLDTMTILWMGFEPEKVGKKAAALIEGNNARILYSITSLWEIGIKMGGRGYRDFFLPEDWHRLIAEGFTVQGIEELQILPGHCRRVQDLPAHHKDPFDRMLIAQALEGGLEVIGCDRQFDAYGVRRVW